jgi:hypothetical protein
MTGVSKGITSQMILTLRRKDWCQFSGKRLQETRNSRWQAMAGILLKK